MPSSWWAPVSDADARTVSCPKCRARKDNPCIYLPTANTSHAPSPYWVSPERDALLARVGKPCRRVHNERRESFRRKRVQQERWLASRDPRPGTPDQLASMRALRELDRREMRQMATWLESFADIFQI